MTDLNKKAFGPQTVSFGPYHHEEEPLKPMEEHRERALLQYLKRFGKSLNPFVESLEKEVEVLKGSYDRLDASLEYDTSRFLQLMILHGCFLLQILSTKADDHKTAEYASTDPIFSRHGKLYIMPYVERDMLMLENQLPMLVLYKFAAVESDRAKSLNAYRDSDQRGEKRHSNSQDQGFQHRNKAEKEDGVVGSKFLAFSGRLKPM
ncbi:unnamed protein product [Dovyalis caffra]|uniref:Uncharacterized protein n=1 Tax=Dovyalis caffra TaxID=77055 RepID=A0AAV1RJE0_9ROSI|nr:unnamed protein product [Dovyalis caffra]